MLSTAMALLRAPRRMFDPKRHQRSLFRSGRRGCHWKQLELYSLPVASGGLYGFDH